MAKYEPPDYFTLYHKGCAQIDTLNSALDCYRKEYRDKVAIAAITTLLQGAVLPTKADRDKWLPQLAGVAYEVADAMVKAREKEVN